MDQCENETARLRGTHALARVADVTDRDADRDEAKDLFVIVKDLFLSSPKDLFAIAQRLICHRPWWREALPLLHAAAGLWRAVLRGRSRSSTTPGNA